jgi:hypothetical protein
MQITNTDEPVSYITEFNNEQQIKKIERNGNKYILVTLCSASEGRNYTWNLASNPYFT